MPYKFKLQKILDLKEKQEDDKKNQMAEVMKQLREKEQELHDLLKTQKEKATMMETIRMDGATIQELRNLTQYIQYIEKCIQKTRFEIETLTLNLEKKKSEYMELRKERKSYEKLKEKDIERYHYMEKKEEEKMIDQIVTFRKRGNS